MNALTFLITLPLQIILYLITETLAVFQVYPARKKSYLKSEGAHSSLASSQTQIGSINREKTV